MRLFYFAHVFSCLIRLIIQTQAHPRLSMLVGTCLQAMDDLWHFFLLMVIVFGGFMFMGISLFAAEKLEFQARNAAYFAFMHVN
jgi:hypothetical protein